MFNEDSYGDLANMLACHPVIATVSCSSSTSLNIYAHRFSVQNTSRVYFEELQFSHRKLHPSIQTLPIDYSDTSWEQSVVIDTMNC